MTPAQWFQLALTLLGLARDFAGWVERTKLKNEIEKTLLAEAKGATDAAIKKANKARADFDARVAADGLRDNSDGDFRD